MSYRGAPNKKISGVPLFPVLEALRARKPLTQKLHQCNQMLDAAVMERHEAMATPPYVALCHSLPLISASYCFDARSYGRLAVAKVLVQHGLPGPKLGGPGTLPEFAVPLTPRNDVLQDQSSPCGRLHAVKSMVVVYNRK